jgi:hypothetical protein
LRRRAPEGSAQARLCVARWSRKPMLEIGWSELVIAGIVALTVSPRCVGSWS